VVSTPHPQNTQIPVRLTELWCFSGTSLEVATDCSISNMHRINKSTLVCNLYRVSQEECARLREGVPYVKVYQNNPKHLCPKLNGYGDNGQRSLKL